MTFIRRIVTILSLPIPLVMFLTGFSPVTKDQQKTREAAVEASTQADFVPVFRFAVASDVHISAGGPDQHRALQKALRFRLPLHGRAPDL